MTTIQNFINKIAAIGGRVFVVGGFVRDKIMGREPHDKDFMVTGVTESDFRSAFPDAERTGKSFPVFRTDIDGEECEVAFARTEKKVAEGHCGFEVCFDPSVTVEEDMCRRDTTMNSMAIDCQTGEVIDPFGGREDIERKIIRATSAHFVEDPVRAIRVARQAACFGFTVAPETIEMMAKCRDEIAKEPTERIFGEMRKAMAAPRPSIFFRVMKDAGIIDVTFPEIAKMIGKAQDPKWHPEGDAFEHTMQVVDKVARETPDIMTRFCAVCHDVGKGETPADILPKHIGHDKRGIPVMDAWNARMTIPAKWMQAAKAVVRWHMAAPRIKKGGKIVDFIEDIRKSPISMEQFAVIVRADQGNESMPPFITRFSEVDSIIREITGEQAPAGMKGPAVGDWIRENRAKAIRDWMVSEA